MKKYELVLDKTGYKLYKSTSIKFLSNVELQKTDFVSINYADGVYSVYMPSSYTINEVETSKHTWRRFKINTVINFELSGILNDVLQTFSELNVSVLVISGYDTDYIFIDEEKLSLVLDHAHTKLSIITDEMIEDEPYNCSASYHL